MPKKKKLWLEKIVRPLREHSRKRGNDKAQWQNLKRQGKFSTGRSKIDGCLDIMVGAGVTL